MVSTSNEFEKKLSVVKKLQQPVWVYDFDNACVCWSNGAALNIWLAESIEELSSRDMRINMTPPMAERLDRYKDDFTRDENVQFREVWTLYPNGTPQTIEIVFSSMLLDDGRMGMLCEALPDALLDAEAAQSARALLHTPVYISLYTAEGEPLYRNPAARNIVSSQAETLSSHFVAVETSQSIFNATEDEVKTVASVYTADGEAWHEIIARRCLDTVTGNHTWLVSEVDVSQLKATEEHAKYLAEHDILTGLRNRNYIIKDFQNSIDQIQETKEKGALIFIDLDHFKDINDSLGHDAGDKLLVVVSNRLKEIIRNDDAVARLGGDEFLILLAPITDCDQVMVIAERIRLALSQPINLGVREVKVTPSIGISLFPDNGYKIDDLMRFADLAMYNVKDSGRNHCSFFSEELSEAIEGRINLESEIEAALDKEQFVTFFQPRVCVKTNAILGAEALVRWIHPEKGMIPPDKFIPACESTGLICQLGKLVLLQTVRAQRGWAEKGINIPVSVNLSPVQFNDESLVRDIIEIVDSNNGDAHNLELEITESVLLGNDQSTIDKLNLLVDQGFGIAIDDFGSGYSNLAYLHRYPIGCLKIDKSFIKDLDTASPIVELIIAMTRVLGLRVVAEGVETKEQLSTLQENDCQEYQGFLFSRPIPYDEFSALISNQQLQSAA